MIGNFLNELVKNLWENFKKYEPAPPKRNEPIYAEYESGTCFFTNPTDFEIQKPTEIATMNSSATSSQKTQKRTNK